MDTKTGKCPLGKQCLSIEDNVQIICPWYVKMSGKNPQSDDLIDEYRCAVAWMPVLMTEHSLFERQTGASVESFRNEMVKQNNMLLSASNKLKLK